MKNWCIVQNKWNKHGGDAPPWRGAVIIEEVDDAMAVPSRICATYRGHPQQVPRLISLAPELLQIVELCAGAADDGEEAAEHACWKAAEFFTRIKPYLDEPDPQE